MEFELLKQKVIAQLNDLLYYPNTIDKKEWEKAEQINQAILNTIDKILRL